jgi:phosphoglycolate phosphatase-like HAD superfamily hydrolase
MLEILRPRQHVPPRAALFDFDGTLSLVRSGWQQIMQAMMMAALAPSTQDEAPDATRRRVAQAIDRLTGHPTIAQMSWLCALVARRGGRPDSAEAYKQQYLEQLGALVARRREDLRRGAVDADALLVPGARALLEGLRARGVLLLLASGTDYAAVLHEAQALRIAQYFGPHIYAPGPHAPGFTKRAVIADVLVRERLPAAALVAFGDGPVEIAETHAAGGLAVGVAFDEQRGAGLDPRKRASLVRAGADWIVADFAGHARLLAYLFSDAPPEAAA